TDDMFSGMRDYRHFVARFAPLFVRLPLADRQPRRVGPRSARAQHRVERALEGSTTLRKVRHQMLTTHTVEQRPCGTALAQFGELAKRLLQSLTCGRTRALSRTRAGKPASKRAALDVEPRHLRTLLAEGDRGCRAPVGDLGAGVEQQHLIAPKLARLLPRRVWLPAHHPCGYRGSVHRPRDTVTLGKLAAQLQQTTGMHHSFHALGDRLTTKGLGQPDDTFQDRQVIGVLEHVTHEGLIDLEHVGGQVLEVGE
ncbi:hypothetical protein RZS08_09755, partial [Arthrospira platensis SPKY1]|nr:hypothetical protein [Arthrospira platensis SPKY1]